MKVKVLANGNETEHRVGEVQFINGETFGHLRKIIDFMTVDNVLLVNAAVVAAVEVSTT